MIKINYWIFRRCDYALLVYTSFLSFLRFTSVTVDGYVLNSNALPNGCLHFSLLSVVRPEMIFYAYY